MLRPLRIELRHSTMLIVFPVLLAVGVYIFSVQLAKGEGQWPGILAAVNWSLIITGPLVAGVAAWGGGRESRRRMLYLRQLSTRPPGTVLLVPLLATALWALASVGVILLIGLVFGMLSRAWGWPSAIWILRILAAGVVFVPLPFIIGHALPRKFTPPVVAVLTYLCMGLVEVYLFRIWPLEALSPLPGTSGTIWYAYNQVLSAGQTLWLAGFATLVVIAWALLLNRGLPSHGKRSQIAMSATASLTVVGLIMVMVQHGQVYSDEGVVYQPVCSGSRPTVCVHPAFTNELATIRPIAAVVSARLSGTPAAFHRVVQRQAGGDPPLDSHSGAPSFSLLSSESGGSTTAMQQLVEQSYLPKCERHPGAADKTMLQQLVVQWLSSPSTHGFTAYLGGSSGTPLDQAVDTFTHMSEANKRTWFRQHYAAFRTCSLNVHMLLPAQK